MEKRRRANAHAASSHCPLAADACCAPVGTAQAQMPQALVPTRKDLVPPPAGSQVQTPLTTACQARFVAYTLAVRVPAYALAGLRVGRPSNLHCSSQLSEIRNIMRFSE